MAAPATKCYVRMELIKMRMKYTRIFNFCEYARICQLSQSW